MNYTVEKQDGNKIKLTVTITKEAFQSALDKAFEKVSKEVKIDGFRQGKVPKAIYLRRFGVASLYEDAVNFALNDSYPEAVKASKINVIAQPDIDLDYSTVGEGKELTYTALVEVEPEVVLGSYFGTKVKPLSTDVLESEIEEKIAVMLKTKAENIIKECAVDHGDTAVINFEGFVDGVAFEGGKGENHSLEIGSGSFIPGFEEQIIGMNPLDERDIIVTFPENYQAEHLAGKEAIFKVRVNEVKSKVIPELSDEIVAELKIEGVKTVDEYKTHTEKTIKEEKDRKAETHLVTEVVNAACNDAKVDIPESMINHEMEHKLNELEEQAKRYNIPMELFLQYNGTTLDEYKIHLREYASKKVKEELVIRAIAKEEKVTLTEDEFEAEYVKLAGLYNQDIQTVKKALSRVVLEDHLIVIKTIDLLKAKAKLE